MTKILDEVLAANAKYAENFGDKGNLPLPPSRRFACASAALSLAGPLSVHLEDLRRRARKLARRAESGRGSYAA